MRKELVFLENEKAWTSTRIIAQECKIEHRAVLQLVKKYAQDLGDFGFTFAFQMRKFKTEGRLGEEIVLDEAQTTFLITLMKNSKIVVSFKKNLTKAFFKQRQIIANLISNRNPIWQNVRADGKQVYLQKTDVIKEFVQYATNQGSKNAQHYYENLAQMENSALFFFEQKYKNMREVLTIKQLMQMSTADDVIDKALKEGMEKGYPYRDCYKLAKSRVIAFAEIIGQSPVLALELKSETPKQITG